MVISLGRKISTAPWALTFLGYDLGNEVVLVYHGCCSVICEIATVRSRKDLLDARRRWVFFLSIQEDIFIVIWEKPTKSLYDNVSWWDFTEA